MKTIVVFQGGGALGAFGAGAWEAIAQWPDVREGGVEAVLGASIGALNAAAVARGHAEADRACGALTRLWRERIATPSLPFLGALPLPVPPSQAHVYAWNGVLTGLLVGNRGLFAADWSAWQPLAGLRRLERPLHARHAMHRLLAEEFSDYASAPGSGPMLAVAAVDIASGELRLFDSDMAPVTAAHLAASSAVPSLFDPVDIEGRLHWDGEFTRDSSLPLFLERLVERGRVTRDEPLQLVTVEQFPREAVAPPQTGLELAYRAINLLQVGKLDLPPAPGVRIARWRRVLREPWPEDGVSGQFDYSPDRLERLIAHGRQAASAARVQPAAPTPPALEARAA